MVCVPLSSSEITASLIRRSQTSVTAPPTAHPDPYLAAQATAAAYYQPYMGASPYVASFARPCFPTCPALPHQHVPLFGGVSVSSNRADTRYGSDTWWSNDRNPDQWYTLDRYGMYRPARRFRDLLVRMFS